MTQTTVALACVLLSALDGEAALRSTLGLRGAVDGTGERQADLELVPSARGTLTMPTLDAALSYAPRVSLRSVDGAVDPTLLHFARIATAWRARPALRLSMDGSAAAGTSDLVRVDAQQDLTGELRTVTTDATVQRIDARLELAAELRTSERSRARIRAWAFERGGLGAASRALLPEERGGAGAMRFSWDAGARDALDLEVAASMTVFAADRRVALGTLGERWLHRVTRTMELHAEAGLGARSAQGVGSWDAIDLLPIAAAGLGSEIALAPVLLGLTLDAELRPAVDSVTASVEERAGLRCAITAIVEGGWSARADVAVALQLRPGADAVAARVGLQGAKAVDRSWTLTAGLWLAQQHDPRSALATFLQWGAFVGGTGLARGRG